MFPSMNLAPFKYLYVSDIYGGPISKLMSKPKLIRPGEFGYEAFAQISQSLFPQNEDCLLYGAFTGTGSDQRRYIAQYKAISEALERWACYEASEISGLGFDIDPSSTGVAAYPGIFPNSAKKIARLEAIERWALANWWQGNLKVTAQPTNDQCVGSIEILTPWIDESHTVVLYTLCKKSSRMAYGFASHSNKNYAVKKAEIELYRNMHLLDEIPLDETPDSKNKNERRLLYFSEAEGQRRFHDRVKRSCNIKKVQDMPNLIVDKELKGPWSKYCFVWRTLFENAYSSHLSDDVDQFYF